MATSARCQDSPDVLENRHAVALEPLRGRDNTVISLSRNDDLTEEPHNHSQKER